MAADIPTTEPDEIVAGDTLKWKRSVADYPADDGWTLKYSFRSKDAVFEITSTADGADHSISVAAATTAGYTPGEYYWTAYATKGTERYRIAYGRCRVVADLAAEGYGYDPRSHVKRVLDAIEAVIEGRASKDQMSYSIAGRTLSRTPIADLLKLRSFYKTEYEREVRAERIRQGLSGGGRILTRFTR